MFKLSFVALLALTACTVPNPVTSPSQASAAFRSSSETSLCSTYIAPSASPLDKQMIEAELVFRGVKQCFGESYGGSTAAAFGSKRYARSASASSTASSANTANCSDFRNGAEAQRYFLAAGGPTYDPNGLDRDGDGLACEYGRQIQNVAKYRAPIARVAAPVRSSGSRCYTGPRGGTYTLTASGNKNYGGC